MAATNGQFWSQVFLKADGTPYQGIQCDHWVAGGTTTNLDVYQEANLAAAHNNPVIGDDLGRVSFYGNGTYRIRIRTSTADGNITLYDWDQVEIIHHTATLRAEDQALSLPAASSASRGRLVGVVDGSGDVNGLWIQRSAAAWLQLLTLPNLSQMIQFNKGTDIASTTSVTIPTDGNFFDVTGTNNIESFSGFTGYPVIYTRFTGVGLTLVHNGTTFVLRTGVSRVTLVNEIICWMQVASGQWVELWSTKDWLPAGGGTGLPTVNPGAILSGNGLLSMQDSGTGSIYQAVTSGGTGAPTWSYGLAFHGPGSAGTGSTRSHEGVVNINANQNLSGVHYYTDFTLASGVTLTVPVGSRALIIVASKTITINGTIAANGGGVAGGAAGTAGAVGADGSNGTDQPAGTGGSGASFAGGARGSAVLHGTIISSGGTQLTGSALLGHLSAPWLCLGGASGGGGGRQAGGTAAAGTGGAGGATIILIAPTIILASTAVLNTSGGNGTNAPNDGATARGGGGGGGAGNIYILARAFTDNGATFTQTGGSGGAGASAVSTGTAGTAGAAGVKQVMIYG